MNYASVLIAFLVIFCSCKAQDSQKSLTAPEAYWYNWIGGLPGVGGTAYEIHIAGVESKDIQFDSLILDEVSLPIGKANMKDGRYIILVSENKSNLNKTGPNANQRKRPDFRQDNPQSATVTGSMEGKPFEVAITGFQKKPNQYMQ